MGIEVWGVTDVLVLEIMRISRVGFEKVVHFRRDFQGIR